MYSSRDDDSRQFPRSSATIAGHPIHPMLITFPIAFLAGALVSDIAYSIVQDPFWAQFSYVLILAGLVTGVVAAVVGSIDFWSNPAIRALRGAWVHMFGNGVVLLLALGNALTRANAVEEALMPTGLVLSVISVLLMVITGWYGGELVYRQRVAVHSPAEDVTQGTLRRDPVLDRPTSGRTPGEA